MGEKGESISIEKMAITSIEHEQANNLFSVEYEFCATTQVPGLGRHCVIDFYCPNQTWIAGVSAMLSFIDGSLEHKGKLNLKKTPASFRVTWLSWT